MAIDQAERRQSHFLGNFLPPKQPDWLTRPLSSRPAPCRPHWLRAAGSHLAVMSENDSEILTPEQVAELLHVSPRTMEEWRRTRTGPPWRRMGRHIRYLRREVLVWFEELDSDG